MKMLAVAVQGKEYLYSRGTEHKVSDAGAVYIRDVLNNAGFMLKPGQVWHIYDVGTWDIEYSAAAFQQFTRRGGRVYRKTC